MQLTQPQIYALAVMAVLTIALIGISYISGLRTGRKAGEETGYENGRRTAATYWKTIIAGIRENNDATLQQLQRQVSEAQSKVASSTTELDRLNDHANRLEDETARLDDLIGRLHAKALTPEDVLNLKLAARQLAIAAKHIARSGTNKPNQAALAEAALKEIASRHIAADSKPTAAKTNPASHPTDRDSLRTLCPATSLTLIDLSPNNLALLGHGDVLMRPYRKPAQQPIERDDNGFALSPRIDYIGDGKSTWERIDDEHREQGLPAPQCM